MSSNAPVPEPGYYIPILVRRRSYVLMRKAEVSAGGLRLYLHRVRRKLDASQPIYLLSGPRVTCEKVIEAARIVELSYGCSKQHACIWGYGLGELARPANVPAPPVSSPFAITSDYVRKIKAHYVRNWVVSGTALFVGIWWKADRPLLDQLDAFAAIKGSAAPLRALCPSSLRVVYQPQRWAPTPSDGHIHRAFRGAFPLKDARHGARSQPRVHETVWLFLLGRNRNELQQSVPQGR